MREKKTFKTEVGGKELSVEISQVAEQASAAVLVQYGDTVVLGTAVMSRADKSVDYLPLKVDYEERFYAAGKILGSRFVRRESRPSEDAVLSGRIVDRVIRPLFDHKIRREIQVVVTVLSYDEENDPDFPGLIAASLALGTSNIPWGGPAAGVRIANIGGKLVVGATNKELRDEKLLFETFAAGPKGKISMIELAGREAQEGDVLQAFVRAQEEVDKLIAFQEEVIAKIGKRKIETSLYTDDAVAKQAVDEFLAPRLEDAVYPHLSRPDKKPQQLDKVEREVRLAALKEELALHLQEKFKEDAERKIGPQAVEHMFEEVVDALVHKNTLEKDLRPDGRGLREVRALDGEIGLFNRTHGSALFIRGNTQALAVTTLAAPGAEQIVETMEETTKRRFMLHYNFPPFSVGEVGPFRGPGRREIGHGALAMKAFLPLIPSVDKFPYTIRVVSEILSSNGSSSMATVCACSLSLMDAGVPMLKTAAGIAMGLMSDEAGNYKVLTDLQGPEDHYGDMDFKVAGTEDGITAVQLDVKIGGLTEKMIRETLEQAKEARLHILGFMKTVIDKPREKLSKYAPAVLQHVIDPDKIGLVIGPGGKMINGLIKKYALAGIDIEEDGRVYVSSIDLASAEAALAEIKSLTHDFVIGEIVEGAVIKVLDFGAIVDLGGGRDGMIHVSELKSGFVKEVGEVVKMGDFVRAKVVRVDADGRIGLSLKALAG
ncbi:MAG: polyribonucleotide nucleotidyltransferase [Patescibacteria group bacterium]